MTLRTYFPGSAQSTPGEDTAPANIGKLSLYRSHRPNGGLSRPRSATIAFRRYDQGVIGS
jgi:hypothetical protein